MHIVCSPFEYTTEKRRYYLMSLWFTRKENNCTSSLFSVSIPFELFLMVLGLMVSLFTLRYLYHPERLWYESVVILVIGFLFFTSAKLSLFSKGMWNRWETGSLKKPFTWFYVAGYVLMILGGLGTLVALQLSS
jgi:predicted tellurium resistance membrane protein TerC